MGVCVDSEHLPLTKTESLFLRLLLSEPGKIFSFDEIFAGIGGEGYFGDEASIRTLVCRLKNKLGDASPAIVNVRGHGYKIETE
jgi:DNA-binding response OmpR family regulator